MQIRPRLEAVIEDMLDGHIMLDEALEEFEKLYIQKAYTRNKKRISHTATAIGIHRNSYVCGYMYDFIELVLPHMNRKAVESAMSKA